MKEDDLQIALCQYMRRENIKFFAVPNGGKRNVREAVKLKRAGVLAGVSDLIILRSFRDIAFVELKTMTGRLSLSQKAFRSIVEAFGFEYYVIQVDNISDGVSELEKILSSHCD